MIMLHICMHAHRRYGIYDQQALHDVCHAYNVTEYQYHAACLPTQGCMMHVCMQIDRQKGQHFVTSKHQYLLVYTNSAMLHSCMQAGRQQYNRDQKTSL